METKTIRQTVFIPAKPEQVYNALMNEAEHSAFTGSKATCESKIGGRFTAWDGYIRGRNLELQKGKKIVQEWSTTEWPSDFPPSTLEITLKEKEEGTELLMVHSKVPTEQAESYRQGWIDYYWTPLKEYLGRKPRIR